MVQFDSVAADSFWLVAHDDASGYYTQPLWRDSPARQYPMLYLQGATMKIPYAQWTLGAPDAAATYEVRGLGPTVGGNQIDIPITTAAFVAPNYITITNVDATNAFEADTVRFINPFNIVWQVRVNGGAWQCAGTSSNPVYVCLAGVQASGFPIPFRVVVHVACATDGAKNRDDAATNAWGRLSGPANLNAFDDATQTWSKKLYYYKPGSTFGQNPAGGVGALLTSLISSGQCSTWRSLIYDAIRLNDVTPLATTTTRLILASVIGSANFLVQKWLPAAWPAKLQFIFGGPDFDMEPLPVPNPAIYGDFTNQNTLVGQNSTLTGPCPSQKAFNNHQFLKFVRLDGTTIYYDASYGVTYTGENDFQNNAIGGFADAGAVNADNRWQIDVTQPAGVGNVNFAESMPPY
jgi:hypothetical protein